MLAEFSRTAGECESQSDVFREMDSVLSKLLDYNRITIRFIDSNSLTIRDAFVRGMPISGFSQDSTHQLEGSVTGALINSNGPLIIADCGTDSILARFPVLKSSANDLPSLLAVPLIYRGTAVGLMQVRSSRRSAFSAWHAELLQTAAAHITPTVVNADQLIQLQREVRERTVLADIGRTVSSTIDFSLVWDELVRNVQKLIPCDRLVLALLAEDSKSVTDKHVFGIAMPNWDERPHRDLSRLPQNEAIRSKRTTIVSQEETDALSQKWLGYKVSERTGLRSAMFAPLVAGDRVIGTLNVKSVKPDAYYARDVVLFEQLAMQISGPVAAAELYSQTVRLGAEKAAHGELKLENEMLAETNKTKSRFISTMSHELLTPLTSIMAFTDIIRRDKSNSLSERDQKHLDVIKRNGHRLKEMIQDLLELSNFETNDLQLGRSEFTLQDSFDRLTASVRPMIDAKFQNLVINVPTGDIRLVSDRDRIEQILSNLVSNACKYSGDYSEIRVDVIVDEGVVRIAVTDSGDGIDENEFPALFNEFSKLDNEVTRSMPGAGLGLAISRKLARAMGGDVDLSSTRGEGSVFTLTLPIVMPMAA